MIGKDIRIERIINRNTNRSVIVPMDHGFSMGQIEGLLDMTKVISDVSDGGANAIVLHKGLVKRGHRKHGRDIGLFIHLSGSTSLNPDPNDKVQVCTVEEAIALGADAVSIHINLGSPNESKMLEIGANVARDCNRWGMPLLIMSYPRGKGIDSFSAQSVGHAVRVAEELGADMIKTNYPGDPEAFRKIVKACSVPVFIAGGKRPVTSNRSGSSAMRLMSAGQVSAWEGTPSSARTQRRLSRPSAQSSTTTPTRRRRWGR